MSITSPLDLNGVGSLVLRWYMKADDASKFTLSGSDVDEWLDPDDTAKKWAYDAVNGTIKAQRLDARTPGGLPAVVFPGTGRPRYLGPSMTDGNGAGASMFMIMKRASDPPASGKTGFCDFSTFGSNSSWDLNHGGDGVFNFGNDRMGWISYSGVSGWHSLIQMNTSAAGSVWYVNGALGLDGGGIPNSFPSTPMLGEEFSGNPFAGEVLEMWFFTGAAFTTQQIADLEEYKIARLAASPGGGGGGGVGGGRPLARRSGRRLLTMG